MFSLKDFTNSVSLAQTGITSQIYEESDGRAFAAMYTAWL